MFRVYPRFSPFFFRMVFDGFPVVNEQKLAYTMHHVAHGTINHTKHDEKRIHELLTAAIHSVTVSHKSPQQFYGHTVEKLARQ